MTKQKIKKLHLGCGPVMIDGFYHIDVLDADHIDHKGQIEDLGFIADNSVELIYCSHVLEHIGRWQIESVLEEWYRVLQPSGRLRLAVPDFAACAQIYYEAGLADGLSGLVGLICGGQKNEFDFHKMIFDEPSLSKMLQKVGFSHVARWDWQTTEHAHIDDFSQAYLPHMDKISGKLMSLNLEATK